MRWGIIIHGPEVIDTGRAQHLLAFFKGLGECLVCMGGAMGAIAVIDAGLEGTVDISKREKVTEAMSRMDLTSDAIVILNHSKSRESGIAFGSILIERLPYRLISPVLQIDRDFIMPLNSQGEAKAIDLALRLELELVLPKAMKVVPGERRVHGVQPGENIWINGNVVGRALESEITMWVGEGAEIHFRGMEIKESGLAKVIPFEMESAIIRTGNVRRTEAPPRSMGGKRNGRIMLIDHSAEDSFFRTDGASLAITVGDDTTRIAGALMYRKGLPIIGIIDGDEDGICKESALASGSVIIKLLPGNDDILGQEVKERFFPEDDLTRIEFDKEDLVQKILEMGGDRVQEVQTIGS